MSVVKYIAKNATPSGEPHPFSQVIVNSCVVVAMLKL